MKPELISPAGDLEKLKIAFQYGADAVYASTPKFSMRTREIGFTEETLKEGIAYAHSQGKKVYLTLNVFPHSSEIEEIKAHALKTIALKPDAIIVADPGILRFVKENCDIPIHLSTQANTTNHLAADFWHSQGISRIVLARELNLSDIKLISDNSCTPEPRDLRPKSSLELEAFVHGAMCMAYSGRCQISNYMTGRDANKGACVQACRFKYTMHGLEEDLRPGEIFPIFEDDKGSYILNSKDLCMIEHVPELIEAGIGSFKIEGRLKSVYYVGAITKAYRQAIDLYYDDPKKYQKEKANLLKEVSKTSSREYTTGFYFQKPDQDTNNYQTSRAKGEWGYVGLVKDYNKKEKRLIIEGKNKLEKGSNVEIMTPDKVYEHKLNQIFHKENEVDIIHAGYIFEIPFDTELPANSFVRVRI